MQHPIADSKYHCRWLHRVRPGMLYLIACIARMWRADKGTGISDGKTYEKGKRAGSCRNKAAQNPSGRRRIASKRQRHQRAPMASCFLARQRGTASSARRGSRWRGRGGRRRAWPTESAEPPGDEGFHGDFDQGRRRLPLSAQLVVYPFFSRPSWQPCLSRVFDVR